MNDKRKIVDFKVKNGKHTLECKYEVGQFTLDVDPLFGGPVGKMNVNVIGCDDDPSLRAIQCGFPCANTFSEFEAAAKLAFIKLMEHEWEENVKFNGRYVYNPHYLTPRKRKCLTQKERVQFNRRRKEFEVSNEH